MGREKVKEHTWQRSRKGSEGRKNQMEQGGARLRSIREWRGTNENGKQ